MNLTISVALASKLDSERLSTDKIDLKSGDRLEGRVIEIKSDGKAVIDFGKFQATTDVSIPAEEGDVVRFVVVEKARQLTLKLEGIEKGNQNRDDIELLQSASRGQDELQEKAIEQLRSQMDRLLQKLAPLEDAISTSNKDWAKGQVSDSSKSVDVKQIREEIETQINKLKEIAANLEKSDIGVDSELESEIQELARVAEKMGGLKDSSDGVKLREILEKEVQPRVERLIERLDMVKSEGGVVTVSRNESSAAFKELSEQVRILSDITGKSIQGLAKEQVSDSSKSIDVKQIREEVETQINKLKEIAANLEKSNIRVDNEIEAEIQALVRVAEKMGGLKNSSDGVELRETIEKEVQPRVERILERLDMVKSEGGEVTVSRNESSAAIRELSEQMRILSDKTGKSIQVLPKEQVTDSSKSVDVKQIREEIETQINKLKEIAAILEKSNIRVDNEIESEIQALVRVAEKMGRSKNSNDGIQLRETLEKEVQPRVERLMERLDMVKSEGETASTSRNENNSYLKELSEQVRILSDTTDEAIRELSQSSYNFGVSKSIVNSEQIQINDTHSIYENIKIALQILQTRLKLSGENIEIPKEIKEIFKGVQADLKLAEASDTLLKQISKLSNLIEEAGIPYEKVVKEMQSVLSEMFSRLSEYKDSQRFQEMGNYIREQVIPQLRILNSILTDPSYIADSRNPGKTVDIRQVLKELQGIVENNLASSGESSNSVDPLLSGIFEKPTELSSMVQQVFQRGLFASSAGERENVAAIARNIEQLLEQLPASSDTLKTSGSELALPDKIRLLLNSLQSHFEPIDMSENPLQLVPRLKSIVEDSGIFFEKKLGDVISKLMEVSTRMQDIKSSEQFSQIKDIIEKDLKPNLLQLREFLNNEKIASSLGDPKTLETIRSGVEEMLSNINMQQNRAVESYHNQEPVQVFSFIVPIKGEESAELKVFYNRSRKKDSPDEFRLSLLLAMDKLGEVRSDFFYLKKDLSITFFVRDQAIKNYLDAHLNEVGEVLSSDFKKVQLNIAVSQEKFVELEEGEEKAILNKEGVNIKI